MLHQHYTEYLKKELDFLKLLISRFHEQEKIADVELDIALAKMQGIYEQLLKLKLIHKQLANVKESPIKTDIVPDKTDIPDIAPAKVPEPTVVEPVIKSRQGETAILADKIRPTVYNPINETLAAQQKPITDLSSRLQTTPLNSVAAGIGLNERFLYIRELFQGNGERYNETIKTLDAAASLDEALAFVKQFEWEQTAESTQQFIHLIHRRHAN
jgi:hypothetical protein